MAKFGINDPRLPERFWAKVAVDPATDCWNWTGALDHCGYGSFKPSGRRKDGKQMSTRGAHRVCYEELVGPVPVGLVLDHTCHTADSRCSGGGTCPHRSCVNPLHLEPVTQKVNVHRGGSLAALALGPTRRRACHIDGLCIHGHQLAGDNLYVDPSGKHKCRKCANEYRAAYAVRHKTNGHKELLASVDLRI